MPTSLAQKLQIKPGRRLAVLNPPPGMLDALPAKLEGVTLAGAAAGPAAAALLFVTSLHEAERLVPDAIGAVGPDGLLWIAYPKGGSGVKTDLNRDRLWAALAPTGWRPVRQVALDEVWSAMRFRPADQVGKD